MPGGFFKQIALSKFVNPAIPMARLWKKQGDKILLEKNITLLK
jgi:hypothetical protein